MRFIVYFLILTPLDSHAAGACRQLFSSYTPHEYQTTTDVQIISSGGLKSEAIEISRDTIKSINSDIGQSIKKPKTVRLEIEKQGENAEFNWGDKIIFPFQFFINGKPKHPKFAQTVLAHEYGHYIFSVNLRESVKKYAEYEIQAKMMIDSHSEVRKRSDDYENAVLDLSKARKEGNEDKVAELRKKVESTEEYFDRASESLDQLNVEVKDSVFTRISILSYHELFADIIAVLHVNQPTAMSDALSSSNTKDASEKFANYSRSFLNRIRLNGWNKNEPHILFAPVRRIVWEYILSNPKYNQNREIMLKEILFCITEEIRLRIDEKKFSLSPEEMNRRLIDSLMSRFP